MLPFGDMIPFGNLSCALGTSIQHHLFGRALYVPLLNGDCFYETIFSNLCGWKIGRGGASLWFDNWNLDFIMMLLLVITTIIIDYVIFTMMVTGTLFPITSTWTRFDAVYHWEGSYIIHG